MEGVRKYRCPKLTFSVNCHHSPYRQIWLQFEKVQLDPCAFDYTKFDDDWFKLTLPFGVELILDDFQPLATMLFCLSTSIYSNSWNFGPQQPLGWFHSKQTFLL